MFSSFRPARVALSFAALFVLAACSSAPQPKFQQELFDSGASPFSRSYNVGSNDACEAARRALLNQGYLTTLSGSDRIDATKDFQPSGDSHVTVEFHVVCTPGEDADGTSIMYANAIQSGYALKKSDTSASVGLSLLGSVSLPIRSNSDAMVKVSSETIQSNAFYDRFFDSVGHYVGSLIKTAPVPVAPVTSTVLPGSPPPVIAATPKVTMAPASAPTSAPTSASVSASTPGATSAVNAPAATQAMPGGAVQAAQFGAAPFGAASLYAPHSPIGLPSPSAVPFQAISQPTTPQSTTATAPSDATANETPLATQPASAQPAPAQAASQ